MSSILSKLTNYQNLTQKEAQTLMRQMMIDAKDGAMSDTIKAAILTALAMKGETIKEITGFAKTMRQFSVKIPVRNPLLDTCGTGGSGLSRLNVSTAAAFILAAAGVKVAKHGNRAAGGRCGSFDLLEGLGAKIELGPAEVAETIKQTNLGFIFAPLYHPAMKNVSPVRRELGIRTVFNILGPLTNPARPQYQILGVSDSKLGPMMIEILRQLGSKRAMVVCGGDGLDEITLTGPTQVWELFVNGHIKKYAIKPEDFGLKRVQFDAIKGGDTQFNIKIIREVLNGKLADARSDLIVLNAATGLYIFGKIKSIKEGIMIALQLIKTGQVKAKLNEYIQSSLKL
jgi:anthranilate phosphoribosyltransferase